MAITASEGYEFTKQTIDAQLRDLPTRLHDIPMSDGEYLALNMQGCAASYETPSQADAQGRANEYATTGSEGFESGCLVWLLCAIFVVAALILALALRGAL